MYRAATGETAIISADDVKLFKNSIEPIAKSGKLAALLAQFPPSFVNDAYGQQMLGAVINAFAEYRLAVELRHRSWSDDPATAAFLCEKHACWVQIDEPEFDFSIAAEVAQTSELAYFRFHGRNAENWWRGNVETRYMYLYSESEIAGLAQKVRIASEASKLTLAYFNNHWQAYAPRNAGDLRKALQLSLDDFQKPLL